MIRKTDPAAIAPYLKDASNFMRGRAAEVVIPETREELAAFLKSNDQPITIAGSGTGLTASRIPLAGRVVSLEKFNQLQNPKDGFITCGPAVLLKDLQAKLKGTGWFYPPNPTETLASMGGTLATNASGSRSHKWGSTRNFVQAVDILLVDGRAARIQRGQSINAPLEFDDGSQVSFPALDYASPKCKNAAGYYVQPDMDWLDLFVGSDGTLCLFAEIVLRLEAAPADFLTGILFLESEESCWRLVDRLKNAGRASVSPCALEYFDRHSLERLRPGYPGIPRGAQAALYFEQDVNDEGHRDQCLEAWYEFLEEQDVSLDDSWLAQSEKDLLKFQEFRHQAPLIINEENSREGRVKLGTDMAVGDSHFFGMMRFYQRTLDEAKIPYVIFGHIGDNHLHVNLLPAKEDVDRAHALYGRWVDQILDWGGTVSAEHGIGKLKKTFYHKMVGPQALKDLWRIKRLFDPDGLLGAGNLL